MAGSGSSGSSGPGGPRSKEQFANGIHHHYHLTLIIYYNPQKQLKLECIKHRSASKDKPPKLPPRDNSIYGPNHIPKVGNANLWKKGFTNNHAVKVDFSRRGGREQDWQLSLFDQNWLRSARLGRNLVVNSCTTFEPTIRSTSKP